MIKAIEVCGLRKSYGRTVALDGLDLSVAAGEVHGFLGPNGAGKTTTIRILLGMLRAGGGTARLLGGDPWRDAVPLHRRLAYVPGDVTLWPTLTGGEIIDLLGRLRGGLDPARRAGLIERFGLDPAKKARTYSTGNRQKVALIAALASDCELLILDEPTAGLDPLMEAVFRDCVQDERRRGRTVLLSSHILSEIEALCDRVTIIRAGKTVETGTLAQLRHLTRTAVTAELDTAPDLAGLAGLHAVTIEPSATTDPAGPDQAAAAPASASPDGASPDGASPASAGPASASPAASSGGAPPASASPAGGHPNGVAHGGAVRLACEVDAAGLGAVLARLVPAGVRSLVSRPPTLEELFLRHYAADPADAARLADADGPVGPDGPAEPAAPAGRGAPA